MINSYFRRYSRSGQTAKSTGSRRKMWKVGLTPTFGLEALEARRLLTGDIAGTVYHDLNENGVREPEEDGLEGWTLFIDSNGDGILNSGELTQVTDVDGDYLFTGVSDGLTTIYEIPQGGFAPTFGFLDHQDVIVLAEDEVKVDFPNAIAQVGTIEGTVWNDVNGDGMKGGTESGLSGWTVFLDDNNNGTRELSEPQTLTDATGAYVFTSVRTGNHRVTEVLPFGWG